MRTEIIIQIYFAINLFIAGFHFNSKLEEIRWYSLDKSDKIWYFFKFIFMILFLITFATVIYVVTFFLFFIIEVCKTINYVFQIDFWWSWFFTKKWENASLDTLEILNKKAKTKKSNTIHGKIYLYGLSLINKKNNFYTDAE